MKLKLCSTPNIISNLIFQLRQFIQVVYIEGNIIQALNRLINIHRRSKRKPKIEKDIGNKKSS